MDCWTLTAAEPAVEPLYLTNGYLGTSLHWDAAVLSDSEPPPCYIRGVYSGNGPDGIDRLAETPCWSVLRYGAPTTIHEYRRDLDLRHGVLRTHFLLQEERGMVRLEHTIFLSRADRHLAGSRISTTPDFDGEITFHTRLAAPTCGDVEVISSKTNGRTVQLRSRTLSYGIEMEHMLSVEESCWDATDTIDDFGVTRVLRTEARAGEEITLTQLLRTWTSLEHDEPLARAQRGATLYADVLREHERAWERLWRTDVEIEGDADIQRFARAGLFYLWSTVREDDRWSIAPMGLSSNGYNGHIFWDAELWMHPTLLVTQPEMARSCVAYRRHTLPAARARAASNGHEGAQFPWEAAFTGEEMTPLWCQTRDFQLHITADVAIGQWWYFLNTGDRQWLRQEGFPVIRACAEYWASRVEYHAEHDRYDISDVVCADEYAEHVNNDAFTNAAAKQTLLIATQAGEILDEPVPVEWRAIAERVYIPYDEVNGRHLEYDGYDGRVTKQADVELLAFPLEYVTDREQVARNLDYYRTVIDPHGPAMSFSVYSIVSAQLGRADDAYDYLSRSFVPNTRPPFLAFSETPTNNEFFFCTGVGGALQALLFGFTGLRLRAGYFELNPILPDRWKALRLRNLYLCGGRVDIDILPGSLTIRRRLDEGAIGLVLDRVTGKAEVVAEGSRAPGLSLTLTDARGTPLWSGAETACHPIPLPDHAGDRLRFRLLDHAEALLDAFLPVRATVRVGG